MEQSIIHVTRVYAIFGEVHKIDKILGGVGVGVYGSLAIFMIISFLWSTFKKKSELSNLANNVRRVFRVFISLFVITRIIWVSLHAFYGQGDTATFILNRAGVMTFMTAFTLVVFYWAERFHKTYYESTTFLPKVGWAFILLNVVMYTFQIIMIFLFVFKDDQREGNPIYEVNIGLDLVVSALISIGFFIYGWLLFCMVKSNAVENGERKIDLLKIIVISLIFTACFLLRVIVFLYRPITGKKFNEIAFYCTAYYIPELIPTILQVYLTETAKEKQEKDEHFIDDLYAEADSSKDSVDSVPDQKPSDESQNLISTPRGDSDRVDRVSMFNSNNYGTI